MKKPRILYSLPFLIFVVLFLFACTYVQAQWIRKADAFYKRSEVSSVVYDGKMYTFTGFGAFPEVETSSEVYDPVTDTWQLLARMPEGKTVTHQGVVLIDNTVWHIGGRRGKHPGPLTDEIWIYNISTNTWVAGPKLVDPATGSALLWGGGGAALLGRTLHVFGGFVINACNNDQDRLHLTLDIDKWLADPVNTHWENKLAPMPTKRNHISTVVLGGKIYALGGQFGHDCDGGQDQKISHMYDRSTDTWTKLTDMPSVRSHAEGGVFAIDGKIYLVAGQGAMNQVTVLDPYANGGLGAWSNIASFQLPYGYEGIAAKVIGNTFIISHGGIGASDKTQKTTYTQTFTRNPLYTFGFLSKCINLSTAPGGIIKGQNLLFTMEGAKPYTLSSNASWLSIAKNANGIAVQTGVDVEVSINTNGLAPGNYSATVTATGTGGGQSYTSASFCVNLSVTPNTNGRPEIDIAPKEQIFSAVKNTTSAGKGITIQNKGNDPLTITNLSLTGTNTTAFTLLSPPSTPFSVDAGKSTTLNIAFKPGNTIGPLNAALRITSNDADEGNQDIALYGLSANGEQGANEPPLDQIVKTLGYAINVGGTGLVLGTSPTPIGDEVLVPLFQKAGSGSVSLKPVARYSPDDLLPYGYYTLSNATPVTTPLATIDLNQEQTLLPNIVAGGKENFDPGNASFGIYVGGTSYAAQNNYTQDNLNTGPVKHAARVYPLKNRSGQVIANSYLIAFEPADNSDYQDYVFIISNVTPAPPVASNTIVRINAGGTSQTISQTTWSGCNAAGACNRYVSGGFAYTQNPLPTISGIPAGMNQSIFQSEWTGGQNGANAVPVGAVAFTYSIPVVNGRYLVRLYFAELNKNSVGLRVFDVNIEGGVKELTNFDIFKEAGGIHKAIVRTFPVTVSDGNVTIEFIRQVENAKISAIEIIPDDSGTPVSQIYEAESAQLSGAVKANDHTGYSGSGFADYINATGDYIQWSVTANSSGPATFAIRYANGSSSNRPLTFLVNGSVASASLTFPPTGAWTNWSTINITAPIQSGTNTITLTANGSGGPNVDYLSVQFNVNTREDFATDLAANALVHLYPNPATHYFTIEYLADQTETIGVQLIDSHGRIMENRAVSVHIGKNVITIPTNHFSDGLYKVMLNSPYKSISQKIRIAR